jgi:hypothetical protein
MIVTQQATEAVSPQHVPCLTTTYPFRRDESVVEPLMVPLGMIMGQVLADDMVEATFTEYGRLMESFLFDRAHEPFTVGVEVWTPWRQEDGFDTAILE